MVEEHTDEEVALRVQRGDIESFSLLVERYEEKMLRYARKFLLHSEDGKDLAQEIFIKAYVNIQSFDARRRFSPWIYRIAHNEFVNAIRKRSHAPISFSVNLDTFFPHPIAEGMADDEAQRKELRQALDTCLEKLNSKYREPLVLYYFEEMDYKEIADILEIPPATVGVRLRRGKALLRNMMQ